MNNKFEKNKRIDLLLEIFNSFQKKPSSLYLNIKNLEDKLSADDYSTLLQNYHKYKFYIFNFLVNSLNFNKLLIDLNFDKKNS